MGLNDTPSAQRVHIGFFGRRNAGKSSLVNAVTGQDLSVVAAAAGTTTDPVRKSMELLPLGPVVIIDTPGMDDEGSLGEKRVRQARRVLEEADMAVLVVDCQQGMTGSDRELEELFKQKDIPYLIALNKCDLLATVPAAADHEIYVSAREGIRIHELKERLARLTGQRRDRPLVRDLLQAGSRVILVIPIDEAAPKGRLILPQQMMVRDILEAGSLALCVRETELAAALQAMKEPPDLVITDSQAFGKVNALVPEEIPLTSFSILMARYKGFLETAVKGAAAIRSLKDGDRVLVAEGCTHHRQCGDIGTVKIPGWLKDFTGANLTVETSSGRSFPDDLTGYQLILHCGACMLNGREVLSRMRRARDQGVPFTNYGTGIAYMHGILGRSIAIFPQLARYLKEGQ